jgi:serine/threonine protein kinase/tetratricopeptide (TPR) repeat protein
MIAEKWEQIKDLFEEALKLSLKERQAFLYELTREDPAIALEVAQLLDAHEEAGDFLLQPCNLAVDFIEDLEAEQHRFSAGDVLCGRFRIMTLIGQGGMGEVYKAWDEELEDYVALKTLRLEISRHELFTSRFRREIQLARKVTHPNVCRIFDSFKHPVGDGTYISLLSMELLQGQTLAEYLKSKGRLTVAQALPIAQQIIAGLNAIHAAGIVHRDLKPSNLVLVPAAAIETKPNPAKATKEAVGETGAANTDVDQNFTIKITDFGIAGRLPDGPSTGHTEVSKLLGTPDYMAPELLEHGRASVQSDIYSLGLVLYEVMTGTKPFAGDSAWKRLASDPPPPNRIMPGLPAAWNKTIACCLERNRTYRFQTVQAVGKSLEDGKVSPKIPPKPFLVRLKRSAKARIGVIITFFLLAVALSTLLYRLHIWQPKLPEGARVLFPEIQIDSKLLASDQTLGAVTDLMRNQLESSTKLVLLNRRQIEDLTLQMAKENKPGKEPGKDRTERTIMREMAWRGGARLLVLGTLSRVGNGYLFNIWAEEVGARPNVELRHWEQSFTAQNKDKIFVVVQQASHWIRNLIEHLPENELNRDPLPQSTTTSSWDALLLFSQAEKLQAAGQKQQAISLLEQSTRVDPDFSLAYMRLGDLYNSLRDEKQGFSNWSRAFVALQRRPVTQKEELRIKALFAQDSGDWKGSENAFRTFEILYPYDYLPSFYLATTLANLNRPEDALLEDQTAERKQPDAYYPVAQEARLELVLGRFTEAQGAIDRLRQMHRQDAADAIQVSFDMLREDYPGAFEAINRMKQSQDPLYESRSYSLEAALLSEMRRFSLAKKVLLDGISLDAGKKRSKEAGKLSVEQADKRPFEEADKWIALAYLNLKTGYLQSCRNAALNAAKKEHGRIHLLQAGTLLARAGFTDDAKRMLHDLESVPDLPVFEQARHQLLGEILEFEGKLQEALQEKQKASDLDVPNGPREYLARILEKTGDLEHARELYRRVAESPAGLWQAPEKYYPGFWSDMTERFMALQHGPNDGVVNEAIGKLGRLQEFSVLIH